ncbi:MAG: hypothetical protein R2780_12370 [Crocinitomicaceae bacterium]|nr:hypothetical protein [Crocinitomicaceae bacterium]
MIKEYDFHCPHCNARLDTNGFIILKTKRENGDEGEIRMDANLGNYQYTHEPPVNFSAGELVDFICTSCNKSLNSDEFENYAKLKMQVDDKIVFDILFSRIAGIQKTYLITEDGIESYTGN